MSVKAQNKTTGAAADSVDYADNEPLVSISQAASILDVSIDTIRRWDKNGSLKSSRPDGKNRYFAVKDLEAIKFSQPLTISEASEQLGVSVSTLRRLEKKGVIKPDRSDNGERLYDRETLQTFLRSDYFVRQKGIEEEILKPLNGKPEQATDNSPATTSNRDPAVNVLLGEHHVSIAKLKRFRKVVLRSVAALALGFAIIVAIITVGFILFPTGTSKLLGYYPSTPASKQFTVGPQASMLARQAKPFSGTALRLLEAVNPSLRNRIAPPETIKDVNDVLGANAAGDIVSKYSFTFPDTSYFKVPDQGLIINLNSDFVDGKQPGLSPGDLAVLPITTNLIKDGAITREKLAPGLLSSLGGGTTVVATTTGAGSPGVTTIVSGASSSFTLAGDSGASQLIQSGDIMALLGGAGLTTTAAASDSLTVTIGEGSGIDVAADSVAVQLASGVDNAVNSSSRSGLEFSSDGGIALLQGCTTNQILKWNGSDWICAADGGGGGGSSVWSGLTDPAANLTLNLNEFTSNFLWNTNNTTSGNFDALTLAITNDGASDPNTQRLLVLKNQSNGLIDAGSTKTESLIRLEHNDDSILDKGIQVISSAGGTINTALDVSAGAIGRAIDVGPNIIFGTTPNIQFDNLLYLGNLGYLELGGNSQLLGSNGLKLQSSGSDITLTSGSGRVVLADGNRLQVGGVNGLAYNAFSNSGGLANGGAVSDDNDLYIEGALEVDGSLNLAGNLTVLGNTIAATNVTSFDCEDCLNFDDLSNNLTLDDSTTIINGLAGDFILDLTSTGDFALRDNGVNFVQFLDDGSVTLGKAAATSAINIGIGSAADTINIGTGTTVADTINIGNAVGATLINIDAGTAGLDVDSTGQVNLDTSQAAANAVRLNATAGGIDADAAGQINLDSAQAAATAIRLNASNVGGGVDIDAGSGGVAVDSTGLIGLTSQSNNASAISLQATSGGINIDSGSWGIDLAATGGNLALNTITSGNISATTATAAGLFNVLTGNLKVGDGTPAVSLNGEDAYIEGTLEVDGNSNLGGDLTVLGTSISAANTTSFNCSNCINWDDIADSLTLDAATSTTRTSSGNENSLAFNFINNGGVAGNDNVFSIVNAASSNAAGDLNTEALLLLDQADTTGTGNSAVDSGLLITNSGGSTLTNALSIGSGAQAIVTALNIASTGVTTDLRLQNGETIDNDADGLVLISSPTTRTSGNLEIAGTTGLNFTGAGSDITFTNGEKIDNDVNNQLRLSFGASGGVLELLNGSGLHSDQVSFDLLNTTSTTINFGGGATTALNIGSLTTGLSSFNADVDMNFAGSENLTLVNTSTSADQLSISATGVSTDGADGLQINFTPAAIAGSNTNSAAHIILGAVADATSTLNGLYVEGNTNLQNGAVENMIYLTNAFNASSASAQLNGLFIDTISNGIGTERAIKIGSGWDTELLFTDSTPTIKLDATDNVAELSVTDSSNNTLLSLKDLSTNFGAALTAGAFISRNSYFGEEFNMIKPTCNDSTALARGDSGGAATCTAGAGELSFVRTGTASAASLADTVNGVERLSATGTATLAAGALEFLGGSTTLATDAQNNWNTTNLPVYIGKARLNVGASNRFQMGLSDYTIFNGALQVPTNGIFFSNCDQNSGDCTQNLRGIVRSPLGSSNVSCGTINSGNFFYVRAEIVSSSSVSFFADTNTTDGINETLCGTISTNVPTAAMSTYMMGYTSQTVTTTNLDVDYFRIWQDDNLPPSSGLSGDQTMAVMPAEATSPDSDLNFYTGGDGKFKLTSATTGEELLGIDSQGNATLKGSLASAGLSINGADGGSVATIDQQGNADFAGGLKAGSVNAKQVVGADIGQQYFTGDSGIENGDVVMLDPSDLTKVKKADQPYNSGIVGVATSAPAMLVEGEGSGNSVIVAAAGTVSVKVSTENGAIKAGDGLTSSSKPGVAMKATKQGAIIGRAVLDYNSEGVSSIPMIVGNGFAAEDFGATIGQLTGRVDSLEQQLNDMQNLVPDTDSSTGLGTAEQDISLSSLSVDNLTVNLDMFINGAMVVNGSAEFKGTALFDNLVTFNSDVTFNGSVVFNNNSAGYAVIKAGETSIPVIFKQPFKSPPIVTISLGDGRFATYSYRNVTSNGFEIILPQAAAERLQFSWTATAINNPQTYVSANP